jgi:UDP-N-acetylmuramoyl-L-alanyl-D-glutamate--2,6-diaminopimelate ligase
MKKLSDIISLVKFECVGNTNIPIQSLVFDSRKVQQGDVFFAIAGTQVDGHLYIDDVIAKGAIAIVCEKLPNSLQEGVCYLKVSSAGRAMGLMAAAYYNNPSEYMKVVGVTGTNGKTTVATLLFHLFRSFGHRCGLISTVQNQIDDEVIPSTHTTPDSVQLQFLLDKMLQNGCEYVFMEASSHAIHQERIAGISFTGTIFTNISHDHLDYHGTFENYIKAKKKLFDEVNHDAFALTNKDDKNGMVMLQNTKAPRYTYALQSPSDFKAKIIESDFNGMLINIDGEEAWFKLVGHFNAYNLLAVYGAAFLLGKEKKEIITHLSNINSVSGRFEYIRSENGIHAIVDYAHTPDALENVLKTIDGIRTKNEELIVVFGCGGNRDTAKRPVMADIATRYGTRIIFTSDNPRNEDPEEILNQMQLGVKPLHYKKTLRITDRKEAIKVAVSLAKKGDVILIAGKGHETYQEVKGTKHHFDDREEVKQAFNNIQN